MTGRHPAAAARGAPGIYAPLLVCVAFALFPVYHMFLTSIKTDGALYNLSLNPLLVSLGALTAEHYRLLFTDTRITINDSTRQTTCVGNCSNWRHSPG
jgi:ABC-type glycerol-3-phosphate transport system permease component